MEESTKTFSSHFFLAVSQVQYTQVNKSARIVLCSVTIYFYMQITIVFLVLIYFQVFCL